MDQLWSCVSRWFSGDDEPNLELETNYKEERPMMLNKILNRVIIIDDTKKDIEKLAVELNKDDISCDVYTPNELRDVTFKRNRQLIFMDLMLDGGTDEKKNIPTIIKILSNNISDDFGLYGLVVWTTYADKVDTLKTDLGKAYKRSIEAQKTTSVKEDGEITGGTQSNIKPPLFIVSLDKNKYLTDGYGALMDDLSKKIQEDTTALFFTTWYESVQKGVEQTIVDIFKLAPEYPDQKKEIKYLLYCIGLNHIGISKKNAKGYGKITEDSFKAFDELLSADLNTQERDVTDLFQSEPQKPWEKEFYKKLQISAEVNTKFFIDTNNLSDKHIIPGYVYKVLKGDSPLIITDKPEGLKNYDLEYENVAIELTPPCDFSNKRIGSRLIGGFAFELKKDITKRILLELKNLLAVERYYKLCMVMLDNKIMVYCFDFRYLYTPSDVELLDNSNYKLWFRAKPKLFADVLQKFSSHAARLGLSNINLS